MVDLHTLTKRYYTIGEVAEMFEETTSVIRYWENKVPGLNAYKDARGTRRFTVKHIDKIKKLHHLIKGKGYTLEGAINALSNPDSKLDLRMELEQELLQLKKKMEKLSSRLDKLAS